MRHELPRPAEILEELGDKVVAQIDRLAVTSFTAALKEMTEYHRFLLDAFATTARDGTHFSYAEVGGWFRSPHQEWIGQYRRLFERAVDQMGRESAFVSELIHVPMSLLPDRGTASSQQVTTALLDMSLIFVHQLENWRTRRVRYSTPTNEPSVRQELTPSDKKIYEDVLLRFVGSWESLLRQARTLYELGDAEAQGGEKQWNALRSSWPYLSRHMRNTAYLLAVAAWNRDEIGASLYRDVVLRWPQTLFFDRSDRIYSPYAILLTPDLLKLDWTQAAEAAGAMVPEYSRSGITPLNIFNALLTNAHQDVVIVASALLLHWLERDQANTLLAPTVVALLNRATDDETGDVGHKAGFNTLLNSIIRQTVAETSRGQESYDGYLDDLVSRLDAMSERPVVPGRVYTPSTLHGRDGLGFSILALLLVNLPVINDDNIIFKRLSDLASLETVFPGGDASLRDLASEFQRFVTFLEPNNTAPERLGKAISPDTNFQLAIEHLQQVLKSSKEIIEKHRRERLIARPVDVKKLQNIRAAIESAITSPPAGIVYFTTFTIKKGTEKANAETIVTYRMSKFGKGQFTDPPMEQVSSTFKESLADWIQESLASRVTYALLNHDRRPIELEREIDVEHFWQAIVVAAREAGPSPILLLERLIASRLVKHTMLHKIAVNRIGQDGRGLGGYLGTVEGVNLYGSEALKDKMLLFSANALKSIRYERVTEGSILDINFEPEPIDPTMGTLVVRVAPILEWNGSPIIELDAAAVSRLATS